MRSCDEGWDEERSDECKVVRYVGRWYNAFAVASLQPSLTSLSGYLWKNLYSSKRLWIMHAKMSCSLRFSLLLNLR